MASLDTMDPKALHNELVDFQAYAAVIYVQLGLTIWEYIVTFPFEWAVWTGRKPFRWPMIAYFGARYSLWVAVIPNTMLVHSPTKVSCEAVYIFTVLGSASEKLFAQLIFAIRAMAVWDYSLWVVVPVSALWVVHLGFCLALVKAATLYWVPDMLTGTGGSCQAVSFDWTLPAAFAITAFMDVLVVALISARLIMLRGNTKSSMTSMLIKDGIIFASISIVPTVTALIMFFVGRTSAWQSSALTFSCIFHALCAMRAYSNLSDYCDRLPASLRYKVSNGTMLDRETLARIAFQVGPGLEDKELPLESPNTSPSVGHGAGQDGKGNSRTFLRPNSAAGEMFNHWRHPFRSNTRDREDAIGLESGTSIGAGTLHQSPMVHTVTRFEVEQMHDHDHDHDDLDERNRDRKERQRPPAPASMSGSEGITPIQDTVSERSQRYF